MSNSETMRVVLGSDHAGFELKRRVLQALQQNGSTTLDVGTDTSESVDYPDIAEAVGQTLLDGKADRGVLICGSGVGASIAANKLPGIRAAICHDAYSARQGVEHDDMNILVLGGRVIGPALALDLVRTFLGARFNHELRHERRLAKIRALEARGAHFRKEEECNSV